MTNDDNAEMTHLELWLKGLVDDAQLTQKAIDRMSCDKYSITYYCRHTDGFSAGVGTELEAYRLAYDWQHADRVNVHTSPAINGYMVQVFESR